MRKIGDQFNTNEPTKNSILSVPWTVEDKKRLLLALRKCGTNNINAIQEEIPHKSLSELRYVMAQYEKRAYVRSHCVKKNDTEESPPVNQWIKLLKKMPEKQGITDIIPRVLKYIALYERRVDDPEVNLRECYMALSEFCNGKSSKLLDEKSNYFLFNCISNLAKTFKKKNNLSCYIERQRKFLRSINYLDNIKNVRLYSNRSRQRENNPILNPLNIPNELLIKKDEHYGNGYYEED